MIYTCSDLHGRYDRYQKLFDIITKEDTLYVLGDSIDRHDDGILILNDIMNRENVKLILGNHEDFLLRSVFSKNPRERDYMFGIWTRGCNGGAKTFRSLKKYTDKQLSDLADYLINCPVFKRITVDGTDYHLSHGSALKSLWDKPSLLYKDASAKETDRILWHSPFYNLLDDGYSPKANYKEDEIYIMGHVPVQRLNLTVLGIYDNLRLIDGGCAFEEDYDSVTSAMLYCLDTQDVYYVR